jgi:outer membrane immunogenic protein
MRKLLLGAAVAAFAAGSAFAADMAVPSPIYTKAPPPAPVYNWTGLYVDGGFGYGMWSADTTTINPTTGACVLCVTQTQGGKGWLGVVGGGYDYQFSLVGYNLVIGALGSYDFSSLKGTIQDQVPFLAGQEKMTSAWAAGARFGWLATPAILTYFNVGATGAQFSGTNMVATFSGAASGFSTPSFSRSGYFIGSGTEIMLGSGWFARAEYRYADYGTTTIPDTNPTGATSFGPNPVGSITFHPVVQSARTELVYKFNWFK